MLDPDQGVPRRQGSARRPALGEPTGSASPEWMADPRARRRRAAAHRSSPATTTRSPSGPTRSAPTCCGGPGSASTARSTPASRRSPARASTTSIVAHGDLPRPEALAPVAVAGTIVLVPDRRRDGTNVVARPTSIALAGRATAAAASSAISPRRSRADVPGRRCAPIRTCRSTSTPSTTAATRSSARRCSRSGSSATRLPTMSANEPGQPATSGDRAPSRRNLPTPARGARRSAPIPTTSSSAAARRSPSGRPTAASCTTSCAPTARRARGTPTPISAGARRAPPGRAARGGPPARAAIVPARCVFLGYVDGELDSDLAARRPGRQGDPRAATRRRARPRPVEAVPPPSRSSPRRTARLRRRRRRPRSALLPGARDRPPSPRAAAAVRGRRARPRRGRHAVGSTRSSTRSRPTRASSSRRCTPSTTSELDAFRRRIAERLRGSRTSRTASAPPRCSR